MHQNSNEIIDCRQNAFQMILPRIQKQAWNAFQGLSFDLKQELQSEVVGHCLKSFVKLFELGRHEEVPPNDTGQICYSGRQIRPKYRGITQYQ